MLMLRTGGQFADSQIRKYLIRALLCFGIAVGAAFATRYIQLSFVGPIATVFAVAVFKESFRRWSNWFVGKRGEMAISDALKSLPDDYVPLNDLMLPNGKGNVDHLIIGLNGLFVIETKNYSSFVKCVGDDWFVNGKKIHLRCHPLAGRSSRHKVSCAEDCFFFRC